MRRLIPLLLAAMLALAGCQSTADSGSSGGGSSSGGAAAVDQGGDNTQSTFYTDTFDGCEIYFGFSAGSSAGYKVSASKEGIGGQVSWKCAPVSSVSRLYITAKLQHALTALGPWTDDDDPSAIARYDGDKPNGSLFPLNNVCTTDWWRLVALTEADEAGGGHIKRNEMTSQPRKVIDEDCARH